MKKFLFITILSLTTFGYLNAQKTIDLYPIADDPISIHDGSPSANHNYGYSTWNIAHTQVGGLGFGTNIGRTLFLFDFKNVPTNKKIQKITFTQYAYPEQAGPTYYGHVNTKGESNTSILKAITEKWTPSLVTWNTRPTTTELNQVFLKESQSKFQDYENIDVTGLIKPMIEKPQANFGFEFRLVTEEITRAMIFCSTNYSDQSKHPKLTIYYEEDNGGGVVVTPPVTPTVKTDTICESKENYFIPNSFSPNDDGINDYFTVYTHNDLKISYLRIFDRWGEMIFEANNITTNDDIKGWNGKFRGRDAPRGTYTYDLKVSDAYQCVKLVKGDISLWR